MLVNSFHFIPLNKPTYFTKIDNLNAGFYILDLEDSVPANEKEIARKNLRHHFINRNNSHFFLRINTESKENLRKDLQLINNLHWNNIIIPKASVDIANKINLLLDFQPTFFLLFETIQSVYNFESILTSFTNTKYVGLGFEDILTEFYSDNTELTNLIQNISYNFIIKSKANALKCIDGISLTRDPVLFQKDCLSAKAYGFDGKMSIYPYQIGFINETWQIPKETYLLAKKLIERYTNVEEVGYTVTNDIIVSPAKIKKAKLIIKTYEEV